MVWLAREPQIGGGFDAAHGQDIDRIHRLFECCSSLDLDDEYDISTPGDQVDLPEFRAIAAADDAITFQYQGKGSKALGGVTATVGLVALARRGHFIARSR